MCGIAGVWAPGAGRDIWSLAEPLGPALRHRGPDEAGWLACWPRDGRTVAVRNLDAARSAAPEPPQLILAHRRLSIVDLVTGWQPLSNESADVWIVYNGEIYNHLALRAELEVLGHRFATRSDTEMVVHAYEAWGSRAFARFNGIFAFAIWDSRRRRLIVARDPLGVKPVYVGESQGRLWFASEVKAAIRAGLCSPAVDRSALSLYLAYRFLPSPQTLFQGVVRVPPGHWVEATEGIGSWNEPARFSPLPPAQEESTNLGEWVERLADATTKAVAGQLMADVPVGALLSGGLDSSLVVSAMRGMQSGPVRSYAIGFPEPGRESELDVARRAAAALGTEHHEVQVSSADFFREWIETIRDIDEPVATLSHVLVRMLCRRVHQDHKVVLTGQGADEPLGGYLRHTAERWMRILGVAPLPALFRVGSRCRPRSELVRRLAWVTGEHELARRCAAAFAVFSPEQRRALLDPVSRAQTAADVELEPMRRWLAGTDGLDPLNRLLYLDARLSLADDLLLGADKVAMASSVEARVPYLDLGYLAVAERIPGRLKIDWWHGRKRLQHLVGRRMLPEVLKRQLTSAGKGWRKKRGFDVPTQLWFEGTRMPLVERLLLGPRAALPEYLDRRALAQLVTEHARGRSDHTRRLAALMTLEVWHRAILGGERESDDLVQLAG